MMVLGGFMGVMALRALMGRSYGHQSSLRRRGQREGCGDEDQT